MRLLRVGTGTAVSFHRAAALASGGEGCIYPVPQDPSLLAKIYHQPSIERSRKLALMVAHPIEDPMAAQGHVSIAWPMDLLRDLDRRGEIVGFVMRRVSDVFPIVSFYNPSGRRQSCPLFNWHYLHQTARNLAAAFAAIHRSGDLVADVNGRNILASPRALVTLVDTDSFQVRDLDNGHVFRCPVGTAEYTPPELQNRDLGTIDRGVEHDCFGLAIILFQLLMEGTHPFAGTYLGGGDPPPYEERIRLGHFPYAEKNSVPYQPMPIAPPLRILYPLLQHLFVRCFEEGHRNPAARPDALAWQNALEEAEASLVTCTVNAQHRYGQHSSSCPWCERKRLLGGRDPFPSTQGVKRGEHLAPPPGANRRRPQPQASPVNIARVFTSRIGSGGRQIVTIRIQRSRYSGLPPVPMQLPHPVQYSPYPGTTRTPAQRQRAISSAVAVVIVACFGLAVLSVGEWQTRIVCAGVALIALFGQKLFQKYPALLSMAGIGYTGFTLLMVGGALTALLFTPAMLAGTPELFVGFISILGLLLAIGNDWRRTFCLKYAIFVSFALISALVLSINPTMLGAWSRALQVSALSGNPNAHANQNEPVRILGGGADDVAGVAWSDDSKRIARATNNGTISIWDAPSGRVQLVLRPQARVVALAWDPDSRMLATGSMPGTIEIWDTDTGHREVTFQQPGGVTALAWKPSGSSLACATWEDQITLWYAWGASHSTLEHTGRVNALAWEPGGKLLASASLDKTIKLWDTESLQMMAQSDGAAQVSKLAWSPNGTTLASIGGNDNQVTLWGVSANGSISKLRTFDGNGAETVVTSIAWNPYGTMLAIAASDQSITLWDAVKWSRSRILYQPTRHIRGLAWSPDGKELAINTSEALLVWDVSQ
jgi:WD40 repeat protein